MQLCSMNFLAASMFHSNRLIAATRIQSRAAQDKGPAFIAEHRAFGTTRN
jgi:hypothetical protein